MVAHFLMPVLPFSFQLYFRFHGFDQLGELFPACLSRQAATVADMRLPFALNANRPNHRQIEGCPLIEAVIFYEFLLFFK